MFALNYNYVYMILIRRIVIKCYTKTVQCVPPFNCPSVYMLDTSVFPMELFKEHHTYTRFPRAHRWIGHLTSIKYFFQSLFMSVTISCVLEQVRKINTSSTNYNVRPRPVDCIFRKLWCIYVEQYHRQWTPWGRPGHACSGSDVHVHKRNATNLSISPKGITQDILNLHYYLLLWGL